MTRDSTRSIPTCLPDGEIRGEMMAKKYIHELQTAVHRVAMTSLLGR